jgi:hypothetical protein
MVSKEAIDFLTRQIRKIAAVIEDKVELKPSYAKLQSVFGVDKILALTIMLETGPISRFARSATTYPTVGKYRASGSATTR